MASKTPEVKGAKQVAKPVAKSVAKPVVKKVVTKAAGQTGKNLNTFLKKAHKNDPKVSSSPKKSDYTIVNATNKVHKKSK